MKECFCAGQLGDDHDKGKEATITKRDSLIPRLIRRRRKRKRTPGRGKQLLCNTTRSIAQQKKR